MAQPTEKRKPGQTEAYPKNEWRTRSEVQRILQSIKSHYEMNIWDKWMTGYKNYLLYKQDRQQEILDFQTNLKLPIVKMFVDTMWTSIYDNNLDLKVSGRNAEDHKNAEAMLNYTQWGFAASNSRKHLMQSLKESMILGNGYGKIGYVDNKTKISYKKGVNTVDKVISEQYPYVKYVSAFNIFHDPTVEYMEDSRYIIERKIMHQKDIIEQYKVFIPDIENSLNHPKYSPYYFFSHDFNRVKYLAFWNQEVVQKFMQYSSLENDYSIFWKNYLTIDFKKEYHEVIEYWEDDTFILIIDGAVLYDGGNPLPIKKKPYFELHYNKIPGIPFGQGMATSLEDIQETADTIFNLTLDNIKLQVAPMFSKMKGGDLFQFGDNKLEYTPFGVVEMNSPEGLTRLQLGTPDFSGTNMMQFLMQLGEMSEGVNSYAVGYQNKVERSATGVSALVQSFKSRLLPLTESLNMALSKIAEMWGIIGVAILPDTIQVKIQTEEGRIKFKEIKMEDIVGKFDIEFDAQALKTATREIRRKNAMDLLTIATTAGMDMATGQYFVNMRELWKYTLDTFELPPEDLIMTEQQVVKKQFNLEKTKMKYQNQNAPAPFAPNATQASGGISPTEGEYIPNEQSAYAPNSTPESDVLKEAMQF